MELLSYLEATLFYLMQEVLVSSGNNNEKKEEDGTSHKKNWKKLKSNRWKQYKSLKKEIKNNMHHRSII